MVTNINEVRMNQRARTKTWGEAKGLARGKKIPIRKKTRSQEELKRKRKKEVEE